MKKKVCEVLLGTAVTFHVPLVYGAVHDYQAVKKLIWKPQIFQVFSQRMEAAIQLMLQLYRIPYVAAKMPDLFKPGESSENGGRCIGRYIGEKCSL
ncbi:MAG: hypothetical protein ACLVB1_14325 [Blautia obeum]